MGYAGREAETYEDFLGVAYPPRQVLDVAIRLHDFWCEIDAEPGFVISGYEMMIERNIMTGNPHMCETAKTTRLAYLPSLSTKLP